MLLVVALDHYSVFADKTNEDYFVRNNEWEIIEHRCKEEYRARKAAEDLNAFKEVGFDINKYKELHEAKQPRAVNVSDGWVADILGKRS